MVESIGKSGFPGKNRLIDKKNKTTTRYGVYCSDPGAGQNTSAMIGDEKAKACCQQPPTFK
jgi:hypothetical protein